MGNIWFNYVKSTVFNALRKHMKGLYPDIFQTTTDQNGNPPKFPCMYLHEIESPFIYDLSHKEVVGMKHYMRLEVFSNASGDECSDIRAEAVDFLIGKYGYAVTLLPVTSQNGVHWGVAQLHRVIGAADTDIVKV